MIRLFSLLVGIFGFAACQHSPTAQPAVLSDASDETMTAVKASLATAMDRAQVELGAGDPTTAPVIAVLPPAPTTFETQSPAMPTIFNLFVRDGVCFAVAEATGDEVALPGVSCRALS